MHLALKLVHRHTTFETNLTGKNPNWQEANQLAIIQVQPRSWAKDYLEQIQLMDRAGFELAIDSRFQPLDHAAS